MVLISLQNPNNFKENKEIMGELKYCWLDKSFDSIQGESINFENKEILAYRKLNVMELVDLLTQAHDSFASKRVPEIMQTLLACHNSYPEYQLVSSRMINAFEEFFVDLLKHFKEEERGFFTYSKDLYKTVQQGFVNGSFLKKSKITSEIFNDEHDIIWDNFNNLIKLVSLYGNMIEGLEVRVLQGKLESLKRDLKKHDSIESQVLVIKVLFMERNLRSMM